MLKGKPTQIFGEGRKNNRVSNVDTQEKNHFCEIIKVE